MYITKLPYRCQNMEHRHAKKHKSHQHDIADPDKDFCKGKEDKNTKFTEIDNVAYNHAFHLTKNDALITSLLSFLTNSCVGNEIHVFTKDDTELQLSAEFKDIIKTYFIPACMRAVQWILITGLVPISFEMTNNGAQVPVVPNFDSVRVECAQKPEGFQVLYRATSNSAEDPNTANHMPVDAIMPHTKNQKSKSDKDKLFVISDFSVLPPTHEGKLQSSFGAVLHVHNTLNLLNAQWSKATEYLADPPMVTQVCDSTKDELERGLSFETVGGTNVMYDAQAAAVQHAKSYARENPGELLGMHGTVGDHGDMSDFVHKALKNSMAKKATCITLPANHVLVRQHLPSPPADYLALVKRNEERICSIFGIPLSVVTGHVGSHRSSSMTQANVNSTEMYIADLAITRMRLDVEVFLTRAMKICCYENHYRQISEQSKETKQSNNTESHNALNTENEDSGLSSCDLLPIGAYCKLTPAPSVFNQEKNDEISCEKHTHADTKRDNSAD